MPSTWGLDGTAEGISVHGEVDLSSAEPFAEEASKAVMEAPATSFLVDLSGVTFMDSSCLAVLLLARTTLTADGGSLILRNPSDAARRLFSVAGLTALFELDVETATGT